MTFKPELLPMTMGSLPHTDPAAAWELIHRWTPAIPAWPQLPRRSFCENMYVQFSEDFPGLVLDREDERIWVDREADLYPALERLYAAYLGKDWQPSSAGPTASSKGKPSKGRSPGRSVGGWSSPTGTVARLSTTMCWPIQSPAT